MRAATGNARVQEDRVKKGSFFSSDVLILLTICAFSLSRGGVGEPVWCVGSVGFFCNSLKKHTTLASTAIHHHGAYTAYTVSPIKRGSE